MIKGVDAEMVKNNVIDIIFYSFFLMFFIYVDIKNDFPVEYIVVLIVAYVSVITYKLIKIKNYKRENAR